MKSFIAFALIVAVATGAVIQPAAVSNELAQINEIVAAINSPSTDPATATLLEQLLMETLGLSQQPISVGPAVVEYEPVAVGPALVDMPVPVSVVEGVADTGVVATPAIVEPEVAPAAVAEVATVAESKQPLVQIIVNVNAAAADAVAVDSPATPVATPAIVPETVEQVVDPVHVVDEAAPAAVAMPAPAVPEVIVEPVQVVEAAVQPVQVVDSVPEPVLVAEPILPVPAVNLPDVLN